MNQLVENTNVLESAVKFALNSLKGVTGVQEKFKLAKGNTN